MTFDSTLMDPTSALQTSRACWNPDIELMPNEKLQHIQLAKLKRQLQYLNANSALYRDKFKSVGFEPADLQDLGALSGIPFTTKQDLRESQEVEPPFGRHLAAPADKLVRITTTAGTTGRAIVQAYTRRDVMLRNESVCRVLWGFGVRPGDRVINGFALSMFNAGVPFCTAIEHLGATSIPVGAERRAEGLLRIALDYRATVLVCTPSFAVYLGERCEDIVGIPAADLGIRVVCGGGEPGFELPGVRDELERVWGTPHIYDLASTSDAHPNTFANCVVREGKHHLTGDMVLVQLIDPATGAILDMVDGAEGEYVFTHLDREACPLLRYRTNDIVRVNTKPCACGRTGFRVDVIGRSDDMLLVRGTNLFPSALQAVVAGFIPKSTGNMRVRLDKPGPVVEPPLKVDVECNQDVGAGEWVDLKKQVENAIRQELHVRAEVTLCEFGKLERTAGKTKLITVGEARL